MFGFAKGKFVRQTIADQPDLAENHDLFFNLGTIQNGFCFPFYPA